MQSSLTSKNVAWTNITAPAAEELAALVRETILLPLDAEFIAYENPRPEITVRAPYLLILIQVPVFDKQLRVTTGASLYFIIKENHLWTLQYDSIANLEKLRQDFETNLEKQEEYFNDGALGLAIYLINQMVNSAFRKLDRVHKHINIAEDAVFQGNERKMVEEVAILARDVMDFRKIIRPHKNLFAQVPSHSLITPAVVGPWLRLHNQVNKLWEMLESLSESTRDLGRTNSNLLQYKEGQLLQMLTYYSIISIPVFILLTPFNPRQEQATIVDITIYWGVLSLLVVVLILIFLRFKGKRVL
ncbi:MAG: CorA family divalent cation transporter [Candidatus Andersenbacteria bacterium]